MASPTRGASSSYGWAQERSVNQYETASTSEDLEDIIENYDLISQTGSDNDSQVLLSKQDPSSTKSQYYSAAANGFSSREDTASFYSALQDGFSVNDYYETIDNPNHLWSRYAVDEMERILPKTNFQVYWCDIIYKIEPKISFSSLWNELDHIIKSSLRSTLYQFQCAKTRTYRPNDDMKVNSLGDSRRPLTILKQISGSFRSGELTAVLGPSGAGKTSLLNFLSRRREDGYTGKLYVENAQRRIKTITIPQSDYLPEYLTVRENLRFASRLKNPDRNHDHEKSVEKMSNLLGLDDCLDTRTKRISGGQQKRLAIAQELLSKPDILILDEPTSGLDSLTCHKTLSVLKDLVKDPASKLLDPIAILVTIHQPQQDVLELFDRIYVLANGGRAIYNGPPGKCVEFVEKHTNVRIPDKDYNPASFLIEVASGEYGEDIINALEAQVRLEFEASKKPARTTIVKDKSFHDNLRLVRHNSYYESGSFDKISKSYDNNNNYCDTKKPAHLSIDQQIARGSSMDTSHFLLKTRILSERCWISILRDPKQLIARLVFHILFPIFFSLMMGPEPGQSNACPNYAAQFKLDDLVKENGQSGDVVHEELLLSLENLAFLFVLIYSLISINIGAITLSFTLDMQRSLKEFYNGWYSMKSYIIARLLTDIPIVMVLPIITLSIAYPMSAQAVGDGVSISYRVLITSMAVILGSLIGQTLGMIVAAIYIGHVSTALFVAQGLTLPMVFLSGFITRTKNMSSLVYALSNISFLRHTLEVAIIARYGFNACNCDPKSITGKDPELVGISGQLRAFTNFWMNSYVQNDAVTNIPTTNNTSSSIEGQSENPDIFQLFAKQISLYNTYGIHVKSCQEVLPYQLYDLSLNETHLPRSFLSLSIFLIITQLLLFIVVKLVVHYRTSL